MGKQLRVLARGTASAPIHSAHAAGMARFVGRFDDLTLGTPFIFVGDDGLKVPSVMPARVCSAEPTTFDQDVDRSEFTEQMLHVRQGDLWPFDEATARMCGVAFDPLFGGEYVKGADGKLVNVAHRDALKVLATAEPASPTPLAPKSLAPSAPSAQEGK